MYLKQNTFLNLFKWLSSVCYTNVCGFFFLQDILKECQRIRTVYNHTLTGVVQVVQHRQQSILETFVSFAMA